MTNKSVVPAPATPATLAEQKSDFTAEGAPPPGKVSTGKPVTARPVKRAHKAKRPVSPRYP